MLWGLSPLPQTKNAGYVLATASLDGIMRMNVVDSGRKLQEKPRLYLQCGKRLILLETACSASVLAEDDNRR